MAADNVVERPSSSRGRLPGAEEVQSILHRGPDDASNAPSPLDCDYVSEALPKQLSRSTSASSKQSHSRIDSATDSVKKEKRLTLTLPVSGGFNSHIRGPPSPTRSIASSILPEEVTSPTGPSDATFLTAIAAQERRVLELKEELSRAEIELKKLKRDWAQHEAQKKRHDARKVQKMRPMSLVGPSPASAEEEKPGWLTQQEIERKKALLNGTKSSSRRVFSGSRHARTLSLLAPTNTKHPTKAVPQSEPSSAGTPTTSTSARLAPSRPALPTRASTNPDLTQEVENVAGENIDLGIPREVLLKTGRQMASDFKDGLWTFIEDLRQATVGEEGVAGNGPRKLADMHGLQHSKASLSQASPRTSRKGNLTRKGSKTSVKDKSGQQLSRGKGMQNQSLVDVGDSFWQDHGLGQSGSTDTHALGKASKEADAGHDEAPNEEITESWDMWDSPVAGKVQAQPAEKAKTKSHASPKKKRASSADSRRVSRAEDWLSPASHVNNDHNSIPWPALVKLAPGNLRRTASHLMDEWERSLTPPADVQQNQNDYLDRVPPAMNDEADE